MILIFKIVASMFVSDNIHWKIHCKHNAFRGWIQKIIFIPNFHLYFLSITQFGMYSVYTFRIKNKNTKKKKKQSNTQDLNYNSFCLIILFKLNFQFRTEIPLSAYVRFHRCRRTFWFPITDTEFIFLLFHHNPITICVPRCRRQSNYI